MNSTILDSVCQVETIATLQAMIDAIGLQAQQFERERNWEALTACEQFLVQTYQLIAALRESAS